MAKINQVHENITIIECFYKSLTNKDVQNVANNLASDLEWWFHGPPQCQHMRRVLTGESAKPEFRFNPRSITVLDVDRVVAEGWEGSQAYWVHVWTLKNGLMTQLREYFNTWLIVRDLRPLNNNNNNNNNDDDDDDVWEIEMVNEKGTLWESQQLEGCSVGRSMPALVLAI
ncbi:hypothetical protein RND81_01G026900 [Saponaria officinalis]|uniref:Wound-induced protein 1 n=1 Tax=Saponaria officinalis TaxID=3572 RepID=A0AAW1N5Q4_SAPOF